MIYLASQSPRRRELLQHLDVAFRVLEVDVDETQEPSETPGQLATRLARAKAAAGLETIAAGAGDVVIGADTIVVLDGQVLGKPRDAAHARETLARLSGRCHRVLSAVALASASGMDDRISESRVCFRVLSTGERDAYVDGGEPLDKAGAYGIQGEAAGFVREFAGSWTGVVGLPLRETAGLLAAAGQNLGLSGSAW